MALYAFAAVHVCWVGLGYRISFGDKFIHFLRMPNVSLDAQYLIERTFLGYLPIATMIYFQFVFGAITLTLVAEGIAWKDEFPLHGCCLCHSV